MDTNVITKHNKKFILNGEDGSAMVLALMVLAILTIIGVSAINTSTTELQIVRNEQIYQINFYQAEASAYEAAQRIELEPNIENVLPRLTSLAWMNDGTSGNSVDFSAAANWVNDGSVSDNSVDSSINADASYAASLKKVEGSLGEGMQRKYIYAVFGQSQSNNGSVIVEIGYKKVFRSNP
jgi:Tfp pilus assembly protein PilX